MAEPYRLLKKLRIGDEVMGLAKELGVLREAHATMTTAVSANTVYEGASVNITEPGAYIIRGRVTFPTASTTGVTRHAIRLFKREISLTASVQNDGSNSDVIMTTIALLNVDSSETYPIPVSVRFYCGKAINASSSMTTAVQVVKIVEIPNA